MPNYLLQRKLTICISRSCLGQVLQTCTFQNKSEGRSPKCSLCNTENIPATTQFCLHPAEHGLAMTLLNVEVTSETFDIFGLTPDGSGTVHIYTQTVHRKTQ